MQLALVIFLAVCFGLVPSGLAGNISSRPAVLNIGALLAYDSNIGRVAKVAISTAVADVNLDPSILPGIKLLVQMHETNCSGSVSVIEALHFMGKDVVAMIGPQSSSIAHVISHVANVRRIPLLSFAATDPTLSSHQYPFFVRTTQSDVFQMTALAELVYYYQWKKVIAIFTDDDYGRNGVASLREELQKRNREISYEAALSPKATKSEIMDLLIMVSSMESRVIVLHMHTDIGFTVLSTSHYLGMMSDGYVWIATDWLSSLLDSSASLGSGIMNMMQGVLALRQHTAYSRKKSSFSSRWSKLIKDHTTTNIRVNSYGLHAYDTVWVIAHALDVFLNNGGMVSFSSDKRRHIADKGNLHLEAITVFDGGKLLLDKILDIDFQGVTGPVQFDSHKHLVHSAYDILNLVGTGLQTIGYWSNYSGLSGVPPETLYRKPVNLSSVNQRLHGAIWPGKMEKKPHGWSFPKNGKELRIGVPNRVTFQEFISIDTNTGNPSGYCIDVFSAAVNLLPYAIPYRFIPFGNGKANPSYDELVEMVASDVFDAAVGDITIVANRSKIVDFTQPYFESGIVILDSSKVHSTDAWSFSKAFTVGAWCILVLSFLVTGVVIWILEHKVNDEFRGPLMKQLSTAFWFSFSTMSFSHKEKPKSSLGRLFMVIWFFTVFVIQSTYIASWSSRRTVEALLYHETGIDDLLRSNIRIGFQVGSFIEKYLVEVIGFPRTRLKPLSTLDEYARALDLGSKHGGVSAIIDEQQYIDLFLSIRCRYEIVSSGFKKEGWGFAFKRDSPLAVDMSNAILRLSESGDLKRIHKKWLSRSKCRSNSKGFSSMQINLSNYSGLFFMFGLASVLAIIVFFFLALRHFLCHHSIENSSSSSEGSSRKNVIQRFLSFLDEKKSIMKSREGY